MTVSKMWAWNIISLGSHLLLSHPLCLFPEYILLSTTTPCSQGGLHQGRPASGRTFSTAQSFRHHHSLNPFPACLPPRAWHCHPPAPLSYLSLVTFYSLSSLESAFSHWQPHPLFCFPVHLNTLPFTHLTNAPSAFRFLSKAFEVCLFSATWWCLAGV